MLLSQCQAEKRTVANPTLPMKHAGSAAGLYWHPDGTHELAPAGTWQIQNAIVDRFNKIGPWGAAKQITLNAGWLLLGCDSNIPFSEHRAAIVWKATRIEDGLSFYLVEGHRSGYGAYDTFNDPTSTKAPYPWSSNNHLPYVLMIHGRGNAGITIGSSTLDLPTPGEPVVWLCEALMNEKRIRWSWATHSGETDLSPELTVASINPGSVGFCRTIINEPIPPGALGRYVYVLDDGGWRRTKSRPWGDYLYPVNDNQPILWAEADGPLHNNGQPLPLEPVPAWSILSPLQIAKLSKQPVICDAAETPVYHPIIDEYDSFNFGQKIKSDRCKLKQVATLPPEWNAPNNHPTYWPMMVIQNQGTVLEGLSFERDNSRGPGASCALTCADYSGGQAFKLRAFDCDFFVGWGDAQHPTAGLYIGWECAGNGTGDHTASEWIFRDCNFAGNVAIHLCGTQTVNFRFETTHIGGFPDHEAPCIIIDGASVTFDHGLYASKAGTLFALGWDASVLCVEPFVDQPGVSLIDFNSHQVGKVDIRLADTCGWHFLSRSPVTVEYQSLWLKDWKKYRPRSETLTYAYHCSYDRLTIYVENSPGLAQEVKLAQADREDFRWRVPVGTPVDRTASGAPFVIQR